jgi:mannose-6-phosphate isomerase-like protein (cupin superfamily)
MAGHALGEGGSTFVIAEWAQEGTPASEKPMPVAPFHRHLEDDEAWYVLEGALCVQVDDVIHRAEAGSAVYAPKGSVHSYWNPDPTPARYLLCMSPATYALIQAIHTATDRSRLSLEVLFRKHGSELT